MKRTIISIFSVFLAVFLAACGSGSPASFKVSNISYAFDPSNPSNITTLAFDLDNPAATVKVALTTDGVLQPCTSATPFTHWTCTLIDVTVTNVSALRVVVTQ